VLALRNLTEIKYLTDNPGCLKTYAYLGTTRNGQGRE